MKQHDTAAVPPAAAASGTLTGSLVSGLIRFAANRAPPEISARLHEEWLADLRERRSSMSRLGFGFGCLWAATMIAHEGVTGAVVPSVVPVLAPVMASPGGHRRPPYMLLETSADTAAICDLNTTPLIDVMLVLLIMLILSLPLVTHAVTLTLPNGSTQTVVKPEVIDLDIDFDGTLLWNGTPVANNRQLEGYFRTAARKDPQPEIRLRPDRHVRYDFVAQVLAASQRSGMRKVGFTNTGEFSQ